MNPTQKLHDAGQSLWLDNITRELLSSGKLQRHIDDLSVTGLTSNPTIFDQAIEHSDAYDADIKAAAARGEDQETIFFNLAIDDLRAAADLFRPIHDRTDRVDGWVSLEVAPLLVDDADGTIAAASGLHRRAGRENLFIKIPGTTAGLKAIEESIFAGIPVNVTLLFSAAQYQAAADAYMRGLERRVKQGLPPDVTSVASVFVSRWDRAVTDAVPERLRNRIGIAAAVQAYRAYRQLLDSDRWQRLANAGARAQRLLFASTSTKDPAAPDILYISALAAPFTVNTMPEETLVAFGDHGAVGQMVPSDGGDCDQVMKELGESGTDPVELASRLQQQGADAFAKSWRSLLERVKGTAGQVAAGR